MTKESPEAAVTKESPEAAAIEGSQEEAAVTGHGSIVLVEQACTSCMVCARECPSWCITLDSHTEPVAGLPAGARVRTQNVLDRFEIDWSLCMYCGICVEECPFDALAWEPQHTAAASSASTLRHGISELGRSG